MLWVGVRVDRGAVSQPFVLYTYKIDGVFTDFYSAPTRDAPRTSASTGARHFQI